MDDCHICLHSFLFFPFFVLSKAWKSICRSCVTESSINCLPSPILCIFNSAGRRLFPAATFAQHLLYSLKFKCKLNNVDFCVNHLSSLAFFKWVSFLSNSKRGPFPVLWCARGEARLHQSALSMFWGLGSAICWIFSTFFPFLLPALLFTCCRQIMINWHRRR